MMNDTVYTRSKSKTAQICSLIGIVFGFYLFISGLVGEILFSAPFTRYKEPIELKEGMALFVLAMAAFILFVEIRIFLMNQKALKWMDFNHTDFVYKTQLTNKNTQAYNQPNNNSKANQTKSNYQTASNTYSIFTCSQCGQKIRIPSGKGRIQITCPKCKNIFQVMD